MVYRKLKRPPPSPPIYWVCALSPRSRARSKSQMFVHTHAGRNLIRVHLRVARRRWPSWLCVIDLLGKTPPLPAPHVGREIGVNLAPIGLAKFHPERENLWMQKPLCYFYLAWGLLVVEIDSYGFLYTWADINICNESIKKSGNVQSVVCQQMFLVCITREQSGFHELSHFSGLQTGQGACRLKNNKQINSQIFKAKRVFLSACF